LTEGWPSSSDVGTLCKKAAGLFIYASTVIKFVASESNPPSERLALITSLPQSTSEEGKSGLDQLYIKVLQQAFCGVHADNSQHHLRFQSVVGTVLLIFDPLSVKGLSELLEINTQHICSTMCSLHSLLLVPDTIEDPIHIFHKSFPDFPIVIAVVVWDYFIARRCYFFLFLSYFFSFYFLTFLIFNHMTKEKTSIRGAHQEH